MDVHRHTGALAKPRVHAERRQALVHNGHRQRSAVRRQRRDDMRQRSVVRGARHEHMRAFGVPRDLSECVEQERACHFAPP